MNLKESFRYQKFLERMLDNATATLTMSEHCLKTTKVHHRHDVNPDVEDLTEVVEVAEFVPNDVVMSFMVHIVGEREKLSVAIGEAKRDLGFDLDASVETNKSRQKVNEAIRRMLRYAPNKSKSTGTGYKFDATGIQQLYRYEMDVQTEEAYDKSNAKQIMRNMIASADEVSAKIDAAMINSEVKYTPPYDVNEQFNDVIETFIQENDINLEDYR